MPKAILLLLFTSLIGISGFSQHITITGRVTDVETEDGITLASIHVKGLDSTISTDFDGYYKIELKGPAGSITASCVGFNKVIQPLNRTSRHQVINFELERLDTGQIQMSVLRKSEAAALTIVQKAIANKPIRNKKLLDSYGYEAYTKMEANLIDLTDRFKQRKIFAPFKFIFKNIDSTSEVKPFLPFFLAETVSDFYHQKHPRASREIIKASKVSGIDDLTVSQFLGSSSLRAELNSEYVVLLNRQFISPLSRYGPRVYVYYLIDSQVIDHYKCYRIRFSPKSLKLAKLEGEMWIVDSLYAVKRIRLKMQNPLKIAPIHSISLNEEFAAVKGAVWMLQKERLTINGIKFAHTPELIIRKSTNFSRFVINEKRYNLDSIFHTTEPDIVVNDSANLKGKSYWQRIRNRNGYAAHENRVYAMIDTLGTLKVTKRYINIVQTVATGYVDVGPVSIGNLYSFIGHNPIEGWRFKYGMRTNAKLTKYLRVGAYGAYGERDKKFRYGAEILGLIRQDPRISISASYRFDLTPTRDYNSFYSNPDFFTTYGLRRVEDGHFIPIKLMEVREFRFKFQQEFKFGYSYAIGALYQRLQPQGNFNFSYHTAAENREPGIDIISGTVTEFSLTQRFAWHERFINSNFLHYGFGSKFPIVSFQIVVGVKNILASQFSYQRFAVTVNDTRFMGLIGRLKYNVEVGKIYGVMPFIFLQVPNTSETYIGAWPRFNTLTKYQFAADRYVQVMAEHHLDGLIFDRIPGLKKLRFHEVWGMHMWWGDMTSANRTANYASMSDNPMNTGLVKVQTANKTPFVEMNAGIENILNFFRIDAVWKMNYLDNRGTRYSFRYGNCGVRLSFSAQF